jgi:hypothetical protein
MTDTTKQGISLAIFGLGIAGGLYGCVAAPRAIFVIGVNDSNLEIWAVILSTTTFLPASVLALWKRFFAGIWLIYLGLLWTCAMFAQKHYVETVRHFRGQSYLEIFAGAMIPAYLLLSIGVFCLITHFAGWPAPLRRIKSRPSASAR